VKTAASPVAEFTPTRNKSGFVVDNNVPDESNNSAWTSRFELSDGDVTLTS
jgi:hypothetical protein